VAVSLLTGLRSPIPGSEKGGSRVRKPLPQYPAGSVTPAGWTAATQTGSGTAYTSPVRAALSGPGYRPQSSGRPSVDYNALIGGDWEVQFAETDMEAQLARARANLRKGLNQGLIDLGVVDPSKLGSLGKYIDKDTITKAAENKYSTMARVAQEETRSKATSNAQLAARGILTSGQTTKNTEDIIAAAEGNRYSALRDYLAAGDQGLMGLADLQSELGWRLAQARAAAAARAASTYYGGYDGGGGYQGGYQGGGVYKPVYHPSLLSAGAFGGAGTAYRPPTIAKPKAPVKLQLGGLGYRPM
jgi:hypothetical protein